jgi:CubicO group peptidase (beta-lactamase class C family)
VADPARGRPVTQRMLFNSWSTGKGSVSTVVQVLAERGLLADTTPVAEYWPEVAAHGKQAITVGLGGRR